MTRYQFTILFLVLAITGLLFINALMLVKPMKVLVLNTRIATDELKNDWIIIEYLVNGNVEQVNCKTLEQAELVRKYLGVK